MKQKWSVKTIVKMKQKCVFFKTTIKMKQKRSLQTTVNLKQRYFIL